MTGGCRQEFSLAFSPSRREICVTISLHHTVCLTRRVLVRDTTSAVNTAVSKKLGKRSLISDYKTTPLLKTGNEYTIVTQTHPDFQTVSSQSRPCRSKVKTAMDNAVDSGINHTMQDLFFQYTRQTTDHDTTDTATLTLVQSSPSSNGIVDRPLALSPGISGRSWACILVATTKAVKLIHSYASLSGTVAVVELSVASSSSTSTAPHPKHARATAFRRFRVHGPHDAPSKSL